MHLGEGQARLYKGLISSAILEMLLDFVVFFFVSSFSIFLLVFLDLVVTFEAAFVEVVILVPSWLATCLSSRDDDNSIRFCVF